MIRGNAPETTLKLTTGQYPDKKREGIELGFLVILTLNYFVGQVE